MMQDNKRVKTLIKNKLFAEAESVAFAAKFPREAIAEISKKHADHLYKIKEFNESLN
jgi:hypothetical protein